MGFGEAVSSCFNKYAGFSGRAPRSEYWWWALFYIIAIIGVEILAGILEVGLHIKALSAIIVGLFELFLLLPSISVAVRRLHDMNRSGWWYGALVFLGLIIAGLAIPMFIRLAENHEQGLDPMYGLNSGMFLLLGVLGLIQLIFGLVMFVWFCMRGTRGPNRFGPDPLQAF